MTRTVVMSDMHGHLPAFRRVLEHSAYTEQDRLIVAGDLIDVGTGDVVSAAEELGATILAGNHEVAAALGIRIRPQNASSLERSAYFMERFVTGAWPLAACVDGWLISHAGLSVTLSDIVDRAGREPEAVASALNDLFRREMADAATRLPLAWDDLSRYRLVGGEMGPLWFRPMSAAMVAPGLKQVAGHTPPELLTPGARDSLAAAQVLLIEPGGHEGSPSVIRYAVIEDGAARVVEA